MVEPFRFYTELHLVHLTGLTAVDPEELLRIIRTVPSASIYYHTHRFVRQLHWLSPEPSNDFAYWLTSMLNLDELGERFASVDIVAYHDVESLRAEFVRILEEYLKSIEPGSKLTRSSPGEEFRFLTCRTFFFATPFEASNLRDFASALQKVSISSIYFHMFEAPMRLKRSTNDFSAYFSSLGEKKLAEEIGALNPYDISLDGLRTKLVEMVMRNV